ncbi:zinc finger CCCH domain-containing protein 24 [Dorcoceras hygrometricum]|uniref:Zinc finger CCCH domain-containing protein 24 n=1 Tax=Dorcoceras hygrometricum TaxID=472368 RepID=A0A2Z7BKD9_9LAMI|nr:zinc finger CCCH domain-containing protein 24 [Dorcoceras hygrometricum]
MECRDSSDRQNQPEDRSLSSEADDIVPDKRKRESEPDTTQQNSWWKTTLCSYFRRFDGSCSHGESCRYAHGEAELRPRPDNTWDPTSERAKKIAKTETDEGEKERQLGGVMMTEALEAESGDNASGLSKCLVNLPMKWSPDDLKKFLSEQGVLFNSVKKKKGMYVGFVTFESIEQARTAVKALDGKSFANNRTLKVSDVVPRSFEKKSKVTRPPNTTQQVENPSEAVDGSNIIAAVIDDDDNDDDSTIPNGSVLKGRSVRNVVTPLAHMTYPNQIENKKNSLMQNLRKLTNNVRKACPNGVSLPEWILKSKEIGRLPCELVGVIESPLINGYRNKCEFSVGYSLQGKPTVGFLLGNFREGVTAVEEPVDCPNISRISVKYAAIFQDFLQHSPLPLRNRLNNSGFWRQLTVREGRKPCKISEADNLENIIQEVLLIVQVCTVGLDDGQVKLEVEKLAQAFSVGSSMEFPPLPLTAFVIQDHTGISNVAPSDAPVRYVFIRRDEGDYGLHMTDDVVEPRINDHINNLRFSISPTAFFQVNTLAAEKLYALAGDWADLGPDTLLFDICCGTGTIGLTLAHRVGMVVGIEMNASAISDAQRNAEINGIKNCNFVCGKAEDVIGSLMKDYLSTPKKLNGISDAAENNEVTTNANKEKISDADHVPGPEDSLSIDDGNGSSGSKCSGDEDGLRKDCVLKSSSPQQQFKNVVAIVDPPRAGLHPTVIKVLRTQSRLRRLVYISCNPESLVANAIELCTPSGDKTEKGNNQKNWQWRHMSAAGLARHRSKSMPTSEPFNPIKAMGVDLFPHTPHCELVMLLER